MTQAEAKGIDLGKLRPYFPAISAFILGLELPKMTFAHFVDAGLISLGIAIFATWLFTTELARKILHQTKLPEVAIQPVVISLCVLVFVVVFAFLVNQNTSQKSPLQTQTDTLIADISEYYKVVPPMPLHIYSENGTKMEQLWNEYLPIFKEWQEKVQSDYYSKFNTRISTVVERLHEIRVITDSEYEDIRPLYIIEPIAYTTSSELVAKLLIYSHRLQILEQTLSTK